MFKKLALAAVAVVAVTGVAQAAPFVLTVNDEYWGGDDHGYGDVIGSKSVFDVQKAEISRIDGKTLTVKIFTNYAGKQGTSGAFTTQYGDLFLNSTWTPNYPGASYPPGFHPSDGYAPCTSGNADKCAPHYKTDKFTPGDWTYAIVMDNNAPGSGDKSGTAKVYAVNDAQVQKSFFTIPTGYSGAGTTLNTSGSGWTFRDGQAVQYNEGSQDDEAGTSATWEVNTAGKYILFTITDGGQLGGTFGTDFGFSWAMTCGNDTIQGWGQLPPVPVPAALPLFASGLLGLAGVAWRRRKARQQAAN